MTLLTASEALAISASNDPDKLVERLLVRVKSAAERGEYSVKIRDHGFGGNEYYQSPERWPSIGKHAIAELRKLGFKADIGSECRQFADVWLEISWAKGVSA